MLERMFERVDFLPGLKTVALAVGITGLYWGNKVGVVPPEVLAMLSPYLQGALAVTLGMKMIRKAE